MIGEASKNLPDSMVFRHPEVDWSGLAGVRNIVTHRYFRVDWHLLWISIRDELPGPEKADPGPDERRNRGIKEPFPSHSHFSDGKNPIRAQISPNRRSEKLHSPSLLA